MTNLEIAQEQIKKEKEEKRIKLTKNALIKKERAQKEIENLQDNIKKLDEEIASLENAEIILNNEECPSLELTSGSGGILYFDNRDNLLKSKN